MIHNEFFLTGCFRFETGTIDFWKLNMCESCFGLIKKIKLI
jgi:hypothetical protein